MSSSLHRTSGGIHTGRKEWRVIPPRQPLISNPPPASIDVDELSCASTQGIPALPSPPSVTFRIRVIGVRGGSECEQLLASGFLSLSHTAPEATPLLCQQCSWERQVHALCGTLIKQPQTPLHCKHSLDPSPLQHQTKVHKCPKAATVSRGMEESVDRGVRGTK